MRNPIRKYPTLLVAAVLVGVVPFSACARNTPEGAGDNPVDATRDFILDGVIDHNGYEACGYLTIRQQHAAARRVGAEECREAFDLARLELGGETIQTVHEVEGLAATSSVRGDRAWVRLTRGATSVQFRLVKADLSEREQFQAPNTEWRIAGGELSLIPPQRS